VEQEKAEDHLECPENLEAPINSSDTFSVPSTSTGPYEKDIEVCIQGISKHLEKLEYKRSS
jgi:hypothetical protein